MDHAVFAVANVAGLAVLLGGIAACVRFDQQGKTRRRELEHAERMRALDLGRPLDDAAVARYHALGAVGVAVPVTALSVAALGSCFALAFREPEWRLAALAVVWLACGGLGVAALRFVAPHLREPPAGPPRDDG